MTQKKITGPYSIFFFQWLPRFIPCLLWLLPVSFLLVLKVLKFYNRLNEKQKRTVSLPSLVLLPTLPSSWLLLRSQVLCHPDGNLLWFSISILPSTFGVFWETVFVSSCEWEVTRKNNQGWKGLYSGGKPAPALVTHGQKWPLVGICNGESCGLFKLIHSAGYICLRTFLQNGKKRFSGFIE